MGFLPSGNLLIADFARDGSNILSYLLTFIYKDPALNFMYFTRIWIYDLASNILAPFCGFGSDGTTDGSCSNTAKCMNLLNRISQCLFGACFPFFSQLCFSFFIFQFLIPTDSRLQETGFMCPITEAMRFIIFYTLQFKFISMCILDTTCLQHSKRYESLLPCLLHRAHYIHFRIKWKKQRVIW